MCDNQDQSGSRSPTPVTVAVYYYSQRIINNPGTEVIESTIKKNTVKFLIIPNPQSDTKRIISFELPDKNVTMLCELLDLAQIKLDEQSKVSHVSDYVMNVDYIIENCSVLLEPWTYLEGTEVLGSSKIQDYNALDDDNDDDDDDDEEWNDDDDEGVLHIIERVSDDDNNDDDDGGDLCIIDRVVQVDDIQPL